MNINSLQRIVLTIAQARGVDPALRMIVGGLAEQSGLALVRNWLIRPGYESRPQDQTLLTRSSILNTRCEQGVAN
jgi:hypothetical protein